MTQRPVMNTEYMARPTGSTFGAIMPWAKQNNVGAINWGFVRGKTQTYLPWDSWCVRAPSSLQSSPLVRFQSHRCLPVRACVLDRCLGCRVPVRRVCDLSLFRLSPRAGKTHTSTASRTCGSTISSGQTGARTSALR